MRQIFIVAFVLMSTVLSFSQRTVKGKVTDESGNPLQGATVFVKSESKGETTDRNGKFVIAGLSRAAYQIEVSYVGYVTETLDARTNVDLNIVLKRAEYEISEITVTSVRANNRSAVAYTNVSKEDIEQRNMGQDIPYLLALTPGFVATSDAGTGIGYTGFRIRGTDANRTNITVNGVPLNDAESHGTFFVNMPDFASSLSSMQVQRGVGTSTNGAAAFGASINMQTEGLNVKPYAEISSTYGSFNTNKNTLKAGTGLLQNKFASISRLSNVTYVGYFDRDGGYAIYLYLAGYRRKVNREIPDFRWYEKTISMVWRRF
jgi:iron complex outermembrane receptor protein